MLLCTFALSLALEKAKLVCRSRHGVLSVGYCEPNVVVVCLQNRQLMKALAESKAQIALFVAAQAHGRPHNTPYSIGELQALGILCQTFQRRIRSIAANLVDPPYGQTVAQPNMTEVDLRLDSVREQMEHHIASDKDSQSHFYIPPTMLDIAGILTAMMALNIRPMVNLISGKTVNMGPDNWFAVQLL